MNAPVLVNARSEEDLAAHEEDEWEAYHEEPKPLRATWRQFMLTWSLAVLTAAWIGATIFVAYNSTRGDPLTQQLFY